jgi:hypothetical protein
MPATTPIASPVSTLTPTTAAPLLGEDAAVVPGDVVPVLVVEVMPLDAGDDEVNAVAVVVPLVVVVDNESVLNGRWLLPIKIK